jgi:hypothetical protein
MLAKRAKPTVWPPPPLKPIGRPQTILKNKPRMMLRLGSGPIPPNERVQIGINEAKELRLISRGRGVLPILVRNDRVRNAYE